MFDLENKGQGQVMENWTCSIRLEMVTFFRILATWEHTFAHTHLHTSRDKSDHKDDLR